MHTNQVTEAQIQEVVKADYWQVIFKKRNAALYFNFKVANADTPYWYTVTTVPNMEEKNFGTLFADAVEYYNQL